MLRSLTRSTSRKVQKCNGTRSKEVPRSRTKQLLAVRVTSKARKKRFSVTEVTYQYNNKYLIDVKLAISLKHHASSFFFAVGLAPLAPLPPDGFVLVRWEGGLCGGFCTGVAAVLRRGVLAGRYGHSIFFLEISIVRYHYKMYTRGFSCKDTFSFSLRSFSLSLSSSSLDPCIV